ncbi:hypothetical protein GCM10020219_031860 [Nonomuraea dietziae]
MAPCHGTTISSAQVPHPAMPYAMVSPILKLPVVKDSTMYFMHRYGWPPTHSAHSWQEGRQLMMTWSPGWTEVTWSPTSTTSPAPS